MSKRKIALYNKAKEICLKIQEKIDSNEYLIVFDWEIINSYKTFKPGFIFNDEEHSINFNYDCMCYVEILAPSNDIWEPSFSSIKEMKGYFERSFQFYVISDGRKYNGRRFNV